MPRPKIIILGAGPAGLGAAFQLAKRKLANVTVLEGRERFGGNAGSFDLSGIRVDYGSHRLHPACDPDILRDIKSILGEDLMDRPRHGRIRLNGKWIHFPLKPLDLAIQLPIKFSVGVGIDLLRKLVSGNPQQDDSASFASVLESGLGRTICREFYFPYSQKIWGLPPEELSAIQAYRRVSAGSIKKLILKAFSTLPCFKARGKGRFFYPKQGFGQISERFYQLSKNQGAKFILGAKIESIELTENTIKNIHFAYNGQVFSERPDYLWSTIPISDLLNYFRPLPASTILQASNNLQYRGMILIYLSLKQERFSEYDAHYFPEANIPITRLSEPKNYSNIREPRNRTVLCAELPCSIEAPEWQMSDEELADLVLNSLKSAAIPIEADVTGIITRRLQQAYPIYKRGYEASFNRIEHWLDRMKNLISFGRQGLFVHDNTHHALFMAYAAVKCLNGNGHFDYNRWQNFRRIFETHVVED